MAASSALSSCFCHSKQPAHASLCSPAAVARLRGERNRQCCGKATGKARTQQQDQASLLLPLQPHHCCAHTSWCQRRESQAPRPALPHLQEACTSRGPPPTQQHHPPLGADQSAPRRTAAWLFGLPTAFCIDSYRNIKFVVVLLEKKMEHSKITTFHWRTVGRPCAQAHAHKGFVFVCKRENGISPPYLIFALLFALLSALRTYDGPSTFGGSLAGAVAPGRAHLRRPVPPSIKSSRE